MRKLITIVILVMAVMAAVVAPLAEIYLPKQPQAIDKLVFFPTKYPAGDWTPTALPFEDITFWSNDGTRLHGWYIPSDTPHATVLIAHGNAGNITSRTKLLRHLQATNVSVFIFDYRGYGRSEGEPTIEGVLQDARAARKKLRDLGSVKDSEMLLMGESLGGAIAVQLAADSAPRALILQSTFSSLQDLAKVHYPRQASMVPEKTFDSINQIAKFEGALFQSHGERDQTIPIALGRKLYDAANSPKVFETIPGANHNDWLTEEYLQRLDAFINALPSRQQQSLSP